MGNMQSLGLGPGHALPAPAAASARNDQFFGADGLWHYAPAALLGVDLGGAGPSNTTTETTLLSATISGGFPAGAAIGDTVRVHASGKWTNNTAAGQTLTLNLYSGATQVVSIVGPSEPTNASQRPWQLDLELVYSIIAGAGAGAIRTIGTLWIGSTGTGFQTQKDMVFNDGAAVTVATNAAAALDLKAQLSTATSGGAAVLNVLTVRAFPKNY